MGYQHVKDICAVTGRYTDKNGEEKPRWETVGKIMKNEEGKTLMFLKRSFNPAGVYVAPGKETDDSIILSLFAPKPRDGQQPAPAAQARPQQQAAQPVGDDDIPF